VQKLTEEPTTSSPRTFRIDADVMRGLEEEARRQGATVNGLTCRILRKYVKIGTKLEQFSILSFPKNDLLLIMNSVTDEELARLGLQIGKSSAKEIMLQLFGELSINTFRQFLSLYFSGYANWASFSEERRGDALEIRIGHSLGDKWSIFLKNYLEGAITETLKKKPEFKYVSSYSIILSITY